MRNQLISNYPASFWSAKWREALPSGNGETGIGVYGGVHRETILLNHEALWAGTVRPELPDISDRLPVARSLLAEGKISQAQDIMTNALKDRGYKPNVAWPLPLGDIRIETPVHKAFSHYSRTLDMETGEITVRWEDGGTFSRKAFVSRQDGVVALLLESTTEAGLEGIRLTLNIHDPDNASKPFGAAAVPLPDHILRTHRGEALCYAARYDDAGDFGAAARVCAGSCTWEEDTVVFGRCSSALILVRLFVNSERETALARCLETLERLPASYPELLERHTALHRPLFLSAQLSLGAGPADYTLSNEELLLDAYKGHASRAYLEKLWSFGRYLLISSSRETGLPCPLLGLWHGDYKAMWTFNMLNENMQMIYWTALSGNMPQLLLAVFDYFESMMDDFRENARKLFGCRGIYIPAVTTPGVGTIQCISRHILCWTAGAGWLAQHYYDYYRYTLDEEFLRSRALPFLREVALFYQDFFTLDENGHLCSSPSVSPENSPGNLIGKPEFPYPEVTRNATMDFAVAKEVLTNLLEGAKQTGMYQDEWDGWEQLLSRIPPYQVNEDGAVREWMDPQFDDNYRHRHQSHLYPVFPGHEVTARENPELFQAFVTAVKKRLSIGISSQTSWSFAHMACVYARMGEGDLALECLDNLSRVCVMNNFFTVHNDWRSMGVGLDMPRAPFQIDANMGFTAAVNDMLLLCEKDSLRILPALPAQWQSGSVTGLGAAGGLTVDIRWDMTQKEVSVSLTARSSRLVRLILPRRLIRCSKPDVEISGSTAVLHLKAKEKETIILSLGF